MSSFIKDTSWFVQINKTSNGRCLLSANSNDGYNVNIEEENVPKAVNKLSELITAYPEPKGNKYSNSYLNNDGSVERTVKDLIDAEKEYTDKAWYVNYLRLRAKGQYSNGDVMDMESAKKVVAPYGKIEDWFPKDDYEVGFIDGTLSALRWAMGDDFGNYYT